MPPVTEKVYGIAEYDVPADVAYLQVAFSFVVTESVATVVDGLSVPVGEPAESTGGGLDGGLAGGLDGAPAPKTAL